MKIVISWLNLQDKERADWVDCVKSAEEKRGEVECACHLIIDHRSVVLVGDCDGCALEDVEAFAKKHVSWELDRPEVVRAAVEESVRQVLCDQGGDWYVPVGDNEISLDFGDGGMACVVLQQDKEGEQKIRLRVRVELLHAGFLR